MKIRRSRKIISLLVTLSFLVAMLVPMVGPAAAASNYSALTAPTVGAGAQNLGSMMGEISAGSLGNGNVISIKLPDNFVFAAGAPVVTFGATPALGAAAELWTPAKVGTDNNALNAVATAGNITATRVSDNEISFRLNAAPVANEKSFMYFYFRNITVPAGFDGDIEATITSSAGFGSGKVVIGNAGTGSITVVNDNAPIFSDSAALTIRISESMTGAMKLNTRSLSLRLPSGFEWFVPSFGATIWGDAAFTPATTVRASDSRILDIDTNALLSSTSKTSFTVNATVRVVDATQAKYGDVEATLSGTSKLTNTGAVLLGTYGDFGTEVSAKDVPEVFAGQLEEKIGDIVIEELSPGSLTASVAGRSILLTLPANAKWGKVDTNPIVQNLTAAYTGFVGTNARTIRYDVTAASTTKAGKITLEDMEIVLSPDSEGDVIVEISGSAGAKGEVVVAKAVKPLTMQSEKKDVLLGVQNQPGSDIIITEVAAGVLVTNEDLVVTMPAGIRFSATPTVSVTEGNLLIDEQNVSRSNDNRSVVIPITGDSTVPSVIKMTNVMYTVDRTYPEGQAVANIGGEAVITVNSNTQVTNYWSTGLGAAANIDNIGPNDFTPNINGIFPSATVAVKGITANCITPAPNETKQDSAFVIGSTTYTVGGVEKTMDVAPYIKGDRTYMPLRYVAYAAGVSDANIMWNDVDKSVVLIKGDRVVKLTIGNESMLINGVTFTMDVAPEIVDPGRTMLPIRWVAQALGCTVDWNADTQTVTVN